ncbi:MAG: DUF1553 domain-containing protein [Planctomycetaceae bacterium]|nr:DUF1553 domain-containing protein [Planctomycetaceae bacterium]
MLFRLTIRHSLCCLLLFIVQDASAQSQREAKWPFTPPQVASAPKTDSPWVRNGIDSFILARLHEAGLTPAPEATRQKLVRRLFLDLIGLPPSPEEVQRFLEDDSVHAYEDLVDRLLSDPRYGERWARLWLDLARYADTAGYEGDPDMPHAWRYRDYVIDAFNDDKPYDLFIKEQIAGDEFEEIMGAGELPGTPPERLVAMTFLRLAPFTEPRGDETRHEMLSEMTSTVGSVFLGLTVGCAKCHDHKYDDIPTKDFYRMKAFFSTVAMPPPEPGDGYQIGGSIPAAFYRQGEDNWADEQRARFRREIEDSGRQLTELKERLAKQVDGEEIDKVLKDDNDTRIAAGDRAEYHRLSDRPRLLRQQLKRLEPVAMSLRHSFGPPYEPGVPTSRVMIRGEYDNPGEVVEAGFLSCVTGNQEPAAIRLDPFKRWPTRSRRMALAEWIASPDNPLTARVIVNRLWHWHFGQGIVPTPSDFGQLSGGPSHPELLDWLALKLVDNNWSLKSIHRLIVTSATYRQTSLRDEEHASDVDPDNRLLWRFNRRRLEAEAVRDSVLAVSGRLNTEQYGLPIFPPLPDDLAERVKYSESKWDTQAGPEGRKRSLYIYQQRTLTMPFMQSFDALVCEESRPRRRHSVTPLQALAMYNGMFVSEEARHFAGRVRAEVGDDIQQQIARAFVIALARSPSTEESTELTALARESEAGLEGVCRVLLNSNEFVYVD